MHSIDGKIHDITALSQERPLLIYVWATWCSICRFTTPSVNTLAEQGGNVVSIAMRSGDDAKLARWVDKETAGHAGGQRCQRCAVTGVAGERNTDAGDRVRRESGQYYYGVDKLLGMKLRLWWAGL
jgi:thiol-disulfide isomerase/thioredoxin